MKKIILGLLLFLGSFPTVFAEDSYWKADINGSFPDEISNNDGTIFEASYTSNGYSNGAYDFDGINDYIDLNYNTTLTDYSISAVIKTTMIPSSWNYMMTVRDSSGGDDEFGLLRLDDNGYVHYVESRNSDPFVGVYSNDPLNDGEFYHIVVTSTRNGSILIYVNGVLQTKTETASDSDLSTPGQDWYIGAYNDDGTLKNYFDGILDEVFIYDHVLTASEITDLYNDGYVSTQICSNTSVNTITFNNNMYNDTDYYVISDTSTSTTYDFVYAPKAFYGNNITLDFNDVDNLSGFSGSLSSSASSFTFDGLATSSPDLIISNPDGFSHITIEGSGTPFQLSQGSGTNKIDLFDGDVLTYGSGYYFKTPITSLNVEFIYSPLNTTTINDIRFGNKSNSWSSVDVCYSISSGEIESVDGNPYIGSLDDYGLPDQTTIIPVFDVGVGDNGLILDFDTYNIEGQGGCKVPDTFTFSNAVINDGVIQPKIGLFNDFTCILSIGKHYASPVTYTGFLNIDSSSAGYVADFDFDSDQLYLQEYKFGDYLLMVILVLFFLNLFGIYEWSWFSGEAPSDTTTIREGNTMGPNDAYPKRVYSRIRTRTSKSSGMSNKMKNLKKFSKNKNI